MKTKVKVTQVSWVALILYKTHQGYRNESNQIKISTHVVEFPCFYIVEDKHNFCVVTVFVSVFNLTVFEFRLIHKT